MQPYKTIEDKILQNKTSFYKLPSGLLLVITEEKPLTETTVHINIPAGAYFEHQSGYPEGTAHFLEHITASKPNRFLKSKDAIKKYMEGTKKRPRIVTNAATSLGYISYYGTTHIKGSDRLLRYLTANVDFPLENIATYTEEERAVILAEESENPAQKYDSFYWYKNFLFQDIYPEFVPPIIGTENSIKSITPTHMQNFYKQRFTPQGSYITIYTSQITPRIFEFAQKIDKILSSNSTEITNIEKQAIQDKFNIQNFNNPIRKNLAISITFLATMKHFTYKDIITAKLLRELIGKIGFYILREEKQLVYGIQTQLEQILGVVVVYDIAIETSLANGSTIIQQLYEFIHEDFIEYLKSPKGQSIFDSLVSDILYPPYPGYSRFYTQRIATYEVFNIKNPYTNDIVKDIIKKVSIDDIIDLYERAYLQKRPRIWIESSRKSRLVKTIIKDAEKFFN